MCGHHLVGMSYAPSDDRLMLRGRASSLTRGLWVAEHSGGVPVLPADASVYDGSNGDLKDGRRSSCSSRTPSPQHQQQQQQEADTVSATPVTRVLQGPS